MDYMYHSSTHRSGVDEGNTKRGKARIADVALKTLLNLNTSMKEMKCWENERSIFMSKIHNQNEKIRCLEANNDALTFEVKNLRSHLAEAEQMSHEKKFEKLSREDKKIDALIVHSAGKMIHTVEDLSSELLSVNESLIVFKDRNDRLQIRTDQLKAMLRVSNGSNKDFLKRVGELRNLVHRSDKEIHVLRNSLENMNDDRSIKTCEERMKRVELLMKELETKLKNDRDAMVTGGNPCWSDYLKSTAKLEDSSEELLLQLETTKAELRARSCGIERFHPEGYLKGINELEELVKRVGFDLKSFKTESMMIGSRVGSESRMQYSKRIRTLEKLVATSKSIINKLIIESREASEEKQAAHQGQFFSRSKKSIEALELVAKKFKSGIKDLEIAVASSDSTKLVEKIRELESSVEQLKKKVTEKEEENDSIGLELTGAKIAFGEKVEALEKLQVKYEKMASRMKSRGRGLTNDDQQRMESLVRELEQTKIEARDTKILRDEVNTLKINVANLVVERADLLEEIHKNRAVIKDKENRILKISKDKESIERTLTKDASDTERKLIIAVEEIATLKREISELKETIESTSMKSHNIASEATKAEKNSSKAPSKDDAQGLESTCNECANLKSKFNETVDEKTKIELELSRMKVQNEALIDHLNSEKASTAEKLKDYRKLVSDVRLKESEFQSLQEERANFKKNIDEAERSKDALRVQVDELRQENVAMRNECLSLTSKVNQQKLEADAQLKKVENEKRQQHLHLESLIKENDKINESLDKARSDKLDIAGTLNDWRLRYEETKNHLDSKIKEAKRLNERLEHALQDSEGLKMREVTSKLEVTRWLEANTELRGTIDVLNSDKAKLEKELEDVNNECQALRSQLAVLRSDNDALRDDSSGLRQRADKLTEDVKKLTTELEQRALEREALIAEHRETTGKHQRKLDDFETEHDALKAELERLRAENSSLKFESNRLSMENEKIRRSGANKSEVNQLTLENDALKCELTTWRNANTKAVKEIELTKTEREQLCQEVHELRTEKCTLKMLLEKMKATREAMTEDSRKVEERLNQLKTENDELRKYLEDAKNNIATRDDRTNELEAERSIFMSTIDELEERHRVSITQTEEMRSRNEKLAKEISNLNRENFALREEVNTLLSVIKKVDDDNSKMRTEFTQTKEELEALKAELTKARADNSMLKSQIDAKRTESSKLESENAALKEKLEELRRSKILDAEEAKQIRSEYERLKLHKVKLESKLMEAQKDIGKYTVATSKLNGLEDKLKGVLRDYVVTKEMLRSASVEVDQLRRSKDSSGKNSKYNDNVDAI